VTKTLARIALLSAASIVGLAPITESASAASTTPVYTNHDSGKTVTQVRGSTFKVRLKGCGPCGLYWSISKKPDAAVVERVGHKTTKPINPSTVGGYDRTTWTFKAVGHGTTTMRMAEHDAKQRNKVIKRFSLTVKVTTPLPASG
jgi:predicted secreted protein